MTIVVTDWLQTRIELRLDIPNVWFFPSRLADDITLTIADIPVGVLQVFRFARMVVNLQGREAVADGEVGCQQSNCQDQNHADYVSRS